MPGTSQIQSRAQEGNKEKEIQSCPMEDGTITETLTPDDDGYPAV